MIEEFTLAVQLFYILILAPACFAILGGQALWYAFQNWRERK